MDNKLELLERYYIGISDIDDQHRKLIDLLNDLQSVIANKGTDEDIYIIVEQFVDYTVFHFSDEERHMKEHSFPILETHKEVHAEIIDDVTKLIAKYKGNKFFRFKFFNIAMDVLMTHIEEDDQRFAKYIKEKETSI